MAKTKSRPKPAPTPPPKSVDDLFGGESGLRLQGRFDTPAVYAWFQKRHKKANAMIDEDGYYRRHGHEWKVPYGVRMAIREKLVYAMVVHKYPFFVTWRSPKTGVRYKKYFMSIPHAIIFIAEKAQYVDAEAAIVCRLGFDIPVPLRGKFPRRMAGRMHYWCPRCMAPRIMRRTGETFRAMRKEWITEKARYEYRDRELALLACSFCEGTNRDSRWRRCNQPWETRKFKRGVRKAKRRK